MRGGSHVSGSETRKFLEEKFGDMIEEMEAGEIGAYLVVFENRKQRLNHPFTTSDCIGR